ncbi:MAG: hypothetical protein K2X39_04020 [Silvanigrellaceae bacterium]|nr:hypothetical protein [Silvanigrellaceae bacterium]
MKPSLLMVLICNFVLTMPCFAMGSFLTTPLWPVDARGQQLTDYVTPTNELQEEGINPFEALPLELIFKVLGYLSKEDLIKLAQVNKKIRVVVKEFDHSLRQVIISGKRLTLKEFEKFLRFHFPDGTQTQVTRIALSNIRQKLSLIDWFIHNYSPFFLQNPRIGDVIVINLLENADKFPFLSTLIIQNINAGTYAILALAQAIFTNKLPNLQWLSVMAADTYDFGGRFAIARLVRAISANKQRNLQGLCLEDSNVGPHDALVLVNAILANNNLRHLKALVIANNNIGPDAILELVRAILDEKLPDLQILSVAGNDAYSTDVLTLIGAILDGKLPSLSTLCIDEAGIDPSVFQTFSRLNSGKCQIVTI